MVLGDARRILHLAPLSLALAITLALALALALSTSPSPNPWRTNPCPGMVSSLSLGTDRFFTSLIENGAQLEALLHAGT